MEHSNKDHDDCEYFITPPSLAKCPGYDVVMLYDWLIYLVQRLNTDTLGAARRAKDALKLPDASFDQILTYRKRLIKLTRAFNQAEESKDVDPTPPHNTCRKSSTC